MPRLEPSIRIGPGGRPLRWGTLGRVAGRPTLAAGDGIHVQWWDLATGATGGLDGGGAGSIWGGLGDLDGRAVLATDGPSNSIELWDPVGGCRLTRRQRAFGLAVGELAWGAVSAPAGAVPLYALGGSTGAVWGGLPGPVLLGGLAHRGDGGFFDESRDTSTTCGAFGEVRHRPVLAVGDVTGAVRLRDLVTGESLAGLPSEDGDPVRWLTFGRVEGAPALAVGRAGSVTIWEPVGGHPIGADLTGPGARTRWGTFAEVGARSVLVTGGDESVDLWDPVARAWASPVRVKAREAPTWGSVIDSEGHTLLVAGGGAAPGARGWELVADDGPAPRPRSAIRVFDDRLPLGPSSVPAPSRPPAQSSVQPSVRSSVRSSVQSSVPPVPTRGRWRRLFRRR